MTIRIVALALASILAGCRPDFDLEGLAYDATGATGADTTSATDADATATGDATAPTGDATLSDGDAGPLGPPAFTTTAPTSAREGELLVYAVGCADPDGETTVLSVHADDTCGGALGEDRTYRLTPSESQGDAACTLAIACADSGATVVQRATVAVAEVNAKPAFVNLPTTVSRAWGRGGELQLEASDSDSAVLSFTRVNTTCDPAPTVDASGLVTFLCPDVPTTCATSFEVSDGEASAVAALTLACTNAAPAFGPAPVGPLREGVTFVFTPTCTDPDGDATTLELDDAAHTCAGALDDAGVYRVTPDEAAGGGACTLALRCSDGLEASQQATALAIVEVPLRPRFTSAPTAASAHVGRSVDVVVTAADDDLPSVALAFEASEDCPVATVSQPAAGSFQVACGLAVEQCTLTIAVDDGDTEPVTTAVAIACTNTPPSVSDVAITPSDVAEGELLTCAWTFVDADGDADRSTVAWTTDGAPSGTGPTLFAPAGGKVVRCVVTPRDAVAAGSVVASAPLTVSDGPPTCSGSIPIPPAGEACGVRAGNDQALLVRADIVRPTGIQRRGALLIVDGVIACVGCECTADPRAAAATAFDCPDVVVSPGLVNAHDHVTYAQGNPKDDGAVRYDHRNEWRTGGGVTIPDKPKITTATNASPYGTSWAELRQIMAGTTSYFAVGGAPGLVRNLDQPTRLEGLVHAVAVDATLPLGNSGIYTDCSRYTYPSATVLDGLGWVPHIAEGVSAGARNEFVCIDGLGDDGGVDLIADNVALVQAIGMTTVDVALTVGARASLVWSPRSNTSLYGFTADAPMFHRLGGSIALGTDWSYTGSLDMLRELACAEQWNARWGDYFTDGELVKMATTWAADAVGFGDVLGALAEGKVADLVLWDARVHDGFRAILDAGPEDILLVLRGGSPPTIDGATRFRRGRPLYGAPALVAALTERQLDYADYDPAVYSATDPTKRRLPEACEIIDVCGVNKRLCVAEQMEVVGVPYATTFAYDELVTLLASGDTSELFPCGAPARERTCVPSRPGAFPGEPGVDGDGDGVEETRDNCPGWFNAVRPLDGGLQPDLDDDGDGDACDPCPFDAFTTACTSVDPDDADGDGVVNGDDLCPSVPDDQGDADADGHGDACDACPAEPNPGVVPCSSTVQAIKRGEVPLGTRTRVLDVVVVAKGLDFFTVQVRGAPSPEYTGLYVFTGAGGTKPTEGQVLELTGTVADFFGQLELTSPTWPPPTETVALPAPLVIDPLDVAVGAPLEKAYEALLVEVQNVTVLTTTPTPLPGENVAGEFVVTGDLRVDDQIYLIPGVTTGRTFTYLRGVLRYTRERDKLLPRSAADHL